MIGSFIEKAMLSYQEDCDLDQSQNRIWFDEMVKLGPGLSMTTGQTLAIKLGDVVQCACSYSKVPPHLNNTEMVIFFYKYI